MYLFTHFNFVFKYIKLKLTLMLPALYSLSFLFLDYTEACDKVNHTVSVFVISLSQHIQQLSLKMLTFNILYETVYPSLLV